MKEHDLGQQEQLVANADGFVQTVAVHFQKVCQINVCMGSNGAQISLNEINYKVNYLLSNNSTKILHV